MKDISSGYGYASLPIKEILDYFLKDGEKDMPVSNELVNEAKRICKLINLKTLKRNIEDYPCKKSLLCKWGNGECKVYGRCKIKSLLYV